MARRRKRGSMPESSDTEKVIDIEKKRRERQRKRQAQAQAMRQAEKAEKKAAKAAKRKKSSKKVKIGALVALIIIVILGYYGLHYLSLCKEQKAEQEKLAALEEEKELAQQQADGVGRDAAIEKQARELLKMIKPGEVYYILPESVTGDSSTTSDSSINAGEGAEGSGTSD